MDKNIFKNITDFDEVIFSDRKEINYQTQKQIPETIQYNTNLCWATSAISMFNLQFKKKHDEELNISLAYFLFWTYFEKVEELFDIIDNYKISNIDVVYHYINKGIDDMGNWNSFKKIINKHGAVVDVDMPHTYFSMNTSELNLLLTRSVRIFAYEYLKSGNKSVKAKCLDKIYKLLCSVLGIPPTKTTLKFTKNGNTNTIEYTPMELAEIFFDGMNNYVQVLAIDSSKIRPFKKYENKIIGYTMYNVDFLSLNKLIDLQMKEKDMVILGYDCRYGLNYYNNVCSLHNESNKVLGVDIIPKREVGFDTNILKINHNALLIDEIAENGEKYKVVYDSFFDKKYCFMTIDWFNNFVFEAIIDKKYLKNISFKSKKLELLLNF